MNFGQTLVWNGLGTLTFNLPSAGPFFIEGKITLPTIVSGAGPSSLVVTINQNGTPIYTGVAGAEGFKVDFNGAFNDAMTIVFSSAADADQGLNKIKATLSIGAGQ